MAIADPAPLIIDQPEDNLDNRMVGRTLTSILTQLKEQRQIIVTQSKSLCSMRQARVRLG